MLLDPEGLPPYQKLLAQLGPPSPLERLGLVSPGQMDGLPQIGECIAGPHFSERTWVVPRDGKRYCSLHLREILRRVAWWPSPMPPF